MRMKVKTTPLQREILWSLAATGECSLIGLLDSLQQKFLDLTPEALLKEVERSLGVLQRMGCLYLDWEYLSGRKLVRVDEWQTLSLERFLSWNEAEGRWGTSSVAEGLKDVVMRLTQGGVEVQQMIAAQSGGLTPVWKASASEASDQKRVVPD